MGAGCGDGAFIDVNRAVIELLGYSRDEFLAMSLPTVQIATDDDVDKYRKKDGTEIAGRITTAAVAVAGRMAYVDVLESIAGEIEIGELEQIAHLGTWRWDVASNVVTCTPELSRIFGLPPEAAPTTFQAYLERIHPADRTATQIKVQDSLASLEPFDAVFRIERPDGEVRWLQSRGRIVVGQAKAARLVGVCQDITDQKIAEAALTTLALHDTLTGLPERALFIDRATQAIRRISRKNQMLAVMFLDLDRFKHINDKLGHAAGDEVLGVIGARLTAMLRPGDTVARVGGDEFAILCEDVTATAAVELARRVVDVVAQPVTVGARLARTGASVGVALCSDAGMTAEAMLRDADSAMYAAKESGRNGFVVFDDAARVRDFERMRRADELQVGLGGEELRLYYQPDIDLTTGTVVGVEALVRWKHPSLGLLGPGDFIRVAEESGLVIALGEWVLNQACGEIAAWPAGPKNSRPLIAVNLSAAQLSQPSFVDSVRAALGETGLEPAQLCLEITESVLMEDVDTTTAALGHLKQLGVRLAIDDFGTGYSSLSYLRRFPVDIVKIDRSFIASVGLDPAADAIVAAVVNLSHALGLDVVAEGVETDDQLVAIRALGCDRAQGHYWSKALPANELGVWSDMRRDSSTAEAISIHGMLVERVEMLRAATRRYVMMEAPSKLGSVVADPRALKTVFDHLLGNAVTYSADDRPVIVTGASDRHWVRVSIADFGVGMTPDESSRCFEQFWQAGNALENRPRGTGIGLFIARSLVEGMGGHIAVRSAKGKGTTFTVALPRSSRSTSAPRRLPGRRNDVGEDSSIREFMRQLGVPNRRGA